MYDLTPPTPKVFDVVIVLGRVFGKPSICP